MSTIIGVLLGAHTFRPRLLPAAFSDLFQGLDPEQQEQDERRASTSRESSNSPSETGGAHSPTLSKILLDAIWSIDLEIESRKEIAVISGTASLDITGMASATNTIDEQVRAAKSRLADVVRELIVSRNSAKSTIRSSRLHVHCAAPKDLVEAGSIGEA